MELTKKIIFTFCLLVMTAQPTLACPVPATFPLVITHLLPSSSETPIMNGASMSVYPTSTYWRQCWSSVDIHSFGGAAMQDWTNLKIQYQQKYHAIMLASIMEASVQKIAIMQSSYQSLLQTMNENYTALSKARISIKTKMLDMKMDYQKSLQEDAINEKKYGFFNDGNGEGGVVRTDTQSYKYFKEICKRNKMFKKTSGSFYNQKRDLSVNEAITKQTERMKDVTGNVNSIATSIIKKHSSEYCTAFDIKYNQCANPNLKLCSDDSIDSGVCKIDGNEVFKLSNIDVDAVNLLRPTGFSGRYGYDGTEIEGPKNKIEDELFDVNYTYTEDQKKGAESFVSLLIYQPSVRSPTVADLKDPDKAEFVSAYNSYISKLNLANYSFSNSIKSKEPLDIEGDIPMSERDVMRYMIHSFGNPDALIASKSGKNLSSEVLIYQLSTIKNKLDLEKYQQGERIELLLATMLSTVANAPELIDKLNSLK